MGVLSVLAAFTFARFCTQVARARFASSSASEQQTNWRAGQASAAFWLTVSITCGTLGWGLWARKDAFLVASICFAGALSYTVQSRGGAIWKWLGTEWLLGRPPEQMVHDSDDDDDQQQELDLDLPPKRTHQGKSKSDTASSATHDHAD